MSIFDDDNDRKFGAPFGVSLPVGPGKSGDRVTANKMLDALGDGTGFRTRQTTMPDGTILMVRTRGGMPVVTRTELVAVTPEPPIPSSIRTFVFNLLTAFPTTGVVANKSGSGMGVLAASYALGAASYYVAPTKDDAASTWNDVIRLDTTAATRKAKVNSGEVTGIVADTDTAFPNYSRNMLPYMLVNAGELVANIPGSTPARSGLFLGVFGSDVRGVASISPTGGEVEVIDCGLNSTYLPHGSFYETGGVYTFASGKYSMFGIGATVPFIATCNYAIVRASYNTPYLSLDSIDGERNRLIGNFLSSPTITYVTTSPFPVLSQTNYGRTSFIADYAANVGAMQLEHLNAGLPGESYRYFQEISAGAPVIGSTQQYSYSGTEQIANAYFAESTVTTNPGTIYELVTYGSQSFSSYYATWNGNTNLYLSLSPLGKTRTISRNAGSGEARNRHSSSTCTLTSTALGVLYSATVSSLWVIDTRNQTTYPEVNDPPPATFIYEAQSGSGPPPAPPADFGTGSPYLAEFGYVPFGGREYNSGAGSSSSAGTPTRIESTVETTSKDYIFADFTNDVYLYLECAHTQTAARIVNTANDQLTYDLTLKYVLEFNGTRTEWPVVTNKTDFTLVASGLETLFSGYGSTPAAAVYAPPPILSPMFTSQASCPFIAYTTAAEHASGVAPEIYLDGKFLAIQPTNGYVRDLFGSVNNFVPHQFYSIFQKFICYESQSSNINARGRMLNATAWTDSLFPPASPKRLQFTNGVKTSVGAMLGGAFDSTASIEISRT